MLEDQAATDVDERLLALAEAMSNIGAAMDSRMEELLLELASAARAAYGERVEGASMFCGVVDLEVEAGAPYLTASELTPLRPAIRRVEEAGRVLRRSGRSDTFALVRAGGGPASAVQAILTEVPEVGPMPGDEPWGELSPPTP